MGTAHRVVEDPRAQKLNVSSARKSCICQLAPNVVHSCLDTVRFCSFLQSKLLSITTRLSRLRPVIDGQESRRVLDKVETPQISIGHASLCTRRSGSPQLASDETCGGQNVLNRVTLQTNTERGSVARDVLFACITFPGTQRG